MRCANSYTFCRDCGTALGWFLSASLSEDEIRQKWVELFYALRHNPNIPKKDALVQALKKRIARQTPALQLHF
jgi:hypothetical protein